MRTPLIVASLLIVPLTAASAQDLWIQVRESVIRTQPVFYSPAVTGVRYGDGVTRLSEEKGWTKVSFRGKQGFLPLSAVSAAQVVLSGRGGGKIQADASDVVLAGKGFSKEVEEQFKQSDSSARYDLLDRAERQCSASPEEVHAFMKAGGLNG